ncbi:hypothetical protein RB195_007330 [Necator americanus]|uniref:Secreted protein n=1 Tax=Necator americanus TaxID=51031 RepID=A0ABR1BZJ6_NECAM
MKRSSLSCSVVFACLSLCVNKFSCFLARTQRVPSSQPCELQLKPKPFGNPRRVCDFSARCILVSTAITRCLRTAGLDSAVSGSGHATEHFQALASLELLV